MRVTGWTVPELRAAPARVVRAHFARIFAGLAWSPELAEAARVSVTRAAYPDVQSYGHAARAKAQAVEALAIIERALWPEDEA